MYSIKSIACNCKFYGAPTSAVAVHRNSSQTTFVGSRGGDGGGPGGCGWGGGWESSPASTRKLSSHAIPANSALAPCSFNGPRATGG